MIPDDLFELATEVLDECRRTGETIATAESCTGGLIAACLTAVAGSSDVVDRGFITYTNEAKMEMLGVPTPLFAEYGAVSEPVARAMAEGALAASPASIGIAVTGIAGPGGATAAKPVGLVHMGFSRRGMPTIHRSEIFKGDRETVRTETVRYALRTVLERLSSGT